MKYLLFFIPMLLIAQPKAKIVTGEVEINNKTFYETTLTYEFDSPIKVKNMKFDFACENQGKKLIAKGKDDKGEPTQQTYLGKMPKVKYKKPKKEKLDK